MKESRLILIFASASFAALMLILPAQTFCQQVSQAAPQMLSSSFQTNASCELGAVLDDLSSRLKDNPDAIGYIVIYMGHIDPPGLFHRHALGVKSVLVNEQQIDPNRIIIIKGGSRDEFMVEYWLAHKNLPPPKSGTVWQPELRQASEGKFDEFFWVIGTEDLYEYRKDSTRLDGFSQALIKNPDAIGYIIGYANREIVTETFLEGDEGEEKEVTTTFRMTGKKVAGWAKDSLIEQFNINPSRIVIIDGGYREIGTVELWLLGPGEKAPKPTPTIKFRDN